MRLDNIEIKDHRILSLNHVAILSCVLLIFVTGQFQLTELLGIKRALEVVLIIPIFLFFLIKMPHKILQVIRNPLMIFSILLIMFNIFYSRESMALLHNIMTMLAIFTILISSNDYIIIGVKWIISIVCFFSILAIST